ncbi:MAG: rRNA maturation RNase YbeY [Bacteroidetes bacterium]|nr:rRNA maturation RNase YbeY [Bacteroidota bacterium]
MKKMKTPPRSNLRTGITVSFQAPSGNIGHAVFEQAIRCVLRAEKRRASSISCVVVSDEEIHALNKRFLNHDYPTDIITFPLEDEPLEAELVISIDSARRQAQDYGVHMREECMRLAIHGMLHLCGYDDGGDTGTERMKAREDELLSQCIKKDRR